MPRLYTKKLRRPASEPHVSGLKSDRRVRWLDCTDISGGREMEWIAGRFFRTVGTDGSNDRWIDAAGGHDVCMYITPPAHSSESDWDDQCARLANLRHPLLNPLLDYGPACRHRFEAYARGGPVALAGTVATRSLAHVAEFVSAAGVELEGWRCGLVMRAAGPERSPGGSRRKRADMMTGVSAVTADQTAASPGGLRPVGRTLQLRGALSALEDALDAMSPAGPSVIHVSGAAGAGLRTLRVLAARSARLRGFTPLSPVTVARYPMVLSRLADRHVCVLDDLDDPARSPTGVAQLITLLAAASPRRHVLIRFGRQALNTGPGIALAGMSTPALIAMVFVDRSGEPTQEELSTAARHSDGLPGVFLSRLNGAYRSSSGASVVHEAPARYVVEQMPPVPPPTIGGRVLGGALRAAPRAAALARQGRHAAAARVLARGLRVLQGRERNAEAAACALQLGWLALDRGDPVAALARFETARDLAGGSSQSIIAAVATGVALVDGDRLIEAEGVLRGALASATTIDDAEAQTSAMAALSRCLYWQKRPHEAIALFSETCTAVGAPASRARLLAAHARCLAALGRTAAAVQAARRAQTLAAETDEPAATASADLALAEALVAAGDAEGARVPLSRAIRVARSAHLPLVRVRALLRLASLSREAARRLGALGRIQLPPLLAARLKCALGSGPARHPPLEPVTQLELLLALSQRAADDDAALSTICGAVIERLGAAAVAVIAADDRLLCLEGRAWPAVSAVTREAFAAGTSIPAEGRWEPLEAAEPVRFGGEVVAVLGCRWTAGAAVDCTESAVMLRAAALAAAPHVRAILDRRLPEPPAAWADLIGESAPAVAMRESVLRAARAPFPVLIEGESGSGKELVARAVHRLGPRRDRRFCALNCAALTDDLVEAELFGHARGAFTGAATERAGLFEEADGGTLFLDEVGELSPRAQAKLLRVLQEGEVRRVGENMPRRVDVRIVAATNRCLADEVTGGRFRADLRFRLDVVRMTVPPLRERTSDVPLLAAHFWRHASARVGSQATLSPEALSALARYDWPGNIRELQNVIAWIAVQSPRRGRIGSSALPRHLAQASVPPRCTFDAAREDFERRFIRAALAGANGQRARAAEAIGVSRQGLAKMIRRLGLGDGGEH